MASTWRRSLSGIHSSSSSQSAMRSQSVAIAPALRAAGSPLPRVLSIDQSARTGVGSISGSERSPPSKTTRHSTYPA